MGSPASDMSGSVPKILCSSRDRGCVAGCQCVFTPSVRVICTHHDSRTPLADAMGGVLLNDAHRDAILDQGESEDKAGWACADLEASFV